jgi:hypothetical protein
MILMKQITQNETIRKQHPVFNQLTKKRESYTIIPGTTRSLQRRNLRMLFAIRTKIKTLFIVFTRSFVNYTHGNGIRNKRLVRRGKQRESYTKRTFFGYDKRPAFA